LLFRLRLLGPFCLLLAHLVLVLLGRRRPSSPRPALLSPAASITSGRPQCCTPRCPAMGSRRRGIAPGRGALALRRSRHAAGRWFSWVRNRLRSRLAARPLCPSSCRTRRAARRRW
jgi:hypothetical protein